MYQDGAVIVGGVDGEHVHWSMQRVTYVKYLQLVSACPPIRQHTLAHMLLTPTSSQQSY